MTSIPIDDVRWPDLIIVELTTDEVGHILATHYGEWHENLTRASLPEGMEERLPSTLRSYIPETALAAHEAKIAELQREIVMDDDEVALLRAKITELEGELSKHQESSFHPNWSMLEATRDSLREHWKIIKERDAKIAELEGELNEERLESAQTGWRREYRDTINRLCAELAEARESLRAYRTCVDNFHDACVGAKNAGLFNQRLCLLAVDQYDALPALPQ